MAADNLANTTSAMPQTSTAWVDPNDQLLGCGFQYEALLHKKSFRLLKLLPSSEPLSSIICTISEHSIDESKLEYAALSYTWGSAQDKREITLNGRPAFVTLNLYLALRQYRHMPGLLGGLLEPLYVWVDALCINQQDHNEKAHQIGYMYQIFAKADLVVAWLGPEGDESEAVMSAISESSGSFDAGAIPVSALLSFFSRPWWTRAWILQEYIAARQTWLVCGSSYAIFISVFPLITKVLRYMDRQSYYIEQTRLRELMSSRWYTFIELERYQQEKGFSLFDTIKLSRESEATDSRDKIFALLGLIDRQTNLQLLPNYALSPCEVFCKAIQAMAKDPMRSSKVINIINELERFESIRHKGHWPLKENVSERLQCDGIACSSQYLCFHIPGKVSGEVSGLVARFIMGLQDPETLKLAKD